MKLFTHIVLVVASSLVACSSGTLDGGSNTKSSALVQPVYSCDNRSLDSYCVEFPSGFTKAEAEAVCDGTVVAAPCPLEHAVGVCEIFLVEGEPGACAACSPTDKLVGTYYDDGPNPHTPATAKETCQKFSVLFHTP